MIKSLSILFTDKCNIYCDHCMVQAGPKGKKIFDENLLVDICNGMQKANLGAIGISGGEPLLYKENLLQTCSKFKEHGIVSYVATNAYWASSLDAANLTVSILKKAGVRCLILSTDDYHQKWVPAQNILNAVRSANDLGVDYEIHISSFDKESANLIIHKLGDIPLDKVYAHAIERIGRAKEIINHPLELVDLRIFSCHKVENPLILLNGKVVACCDLPAAPDYEPQVDNPLYLGNIYNQNLIDILRKAENSLYLLLIKNFGPDGLWEKLTDEMGIKQKKPYEGCKLCYWLGNFMNSSASFYD